MSQEKTHWKNREEFYSYFSRAQPDWAYEFPDRTGPDTQICRTGLNPDFYFLNILQFSQDKFPVHKFSVKDAHRQNK